MRETAIELIPSAALKKAIREKDFPLSETDILMMLYGYAPDYATRLTLLRRFAETATPAMAAYAQRCVEWQEAMWQSFSTPEAGMLYELMVLETPDEQREYAERQLCTSVEAAMHYIDLIWDYYADIDCKERPNTRYYLTKRRICDSTEAKYQYDRVAEAVFGPGKTLLTIDDDCFECPVEPPCDYNCPDCHRDFDGQCLRIGDYKDVEFPQFLSHLSLVRYTESDGRVRYALYRAYDSETTSNFYVYPLEHEIIRNHRFEDLWDTHEHAEPPLTEPADESELTEKMRDDYHACLAWITAHPDR